MYIFIIILFVISFLFSFLIFLTYRKKKKLSNKDNKFILKKWNQIQDNQDKKSAIIEADKVLYFTLMKKGINGTLAEKLKIANAFFSDLNGIWEAHKLRNKIVHELDIKISEFELKRALGNFKRALRDLGVQF